MTASLQLPVRSIRPSAHAATAGSATAATKAAADAGVASQSAAFDSSQAESAELQRELEALDEMMMAQLKDEDAILKKWIAMIG